MNDRLGKLRDFLNDKKLDAVLVSTPENRRYLSGFTGSSGYLLITRTDAKLITDFRYIEQAGNQAKQFEIIRHGNKPLETVAKSVSSTLRRIGFESDHLTFGVYDSLHTLLKNIELQPVQLDGLRMSKDAGEIALIRTAVEIADAAFSHILTWLRPGLTEFTVAAELEFAMRKQGAEKPAFDTIVASGARGALPHGIASDKVIADGDLITMDFGAVYQGYHSDITRTVCVGKASARQREIYDIVLAAQLAGLKAVQAGKIGKDVDAVARRVIAAAGYGEYFGHSLGHGVGLAIHEAPALSPGNTAIALAENMLVTVEPGIYLPEWGGVRIEDTVVVTAGGCDILTASSKQFIEIG
ncbi:aminopeptidase P family protein|uniref:Xaa-Pro aminopeptidase n=1 Tax=Dendrosporobacter quercicolus TaxID=146817 RepID=A0A1G9KV11_9FIRM|nr:Xaa-Pro peptidase family protein [Dendrosporobacter quercicolus]NSL46510.1 aminopeptidase P family protein [Dendrosporobacter quercicolus DSM 1736]SDL53551.1 Xaa-Pro aminopeptidase [Dendrosporobacter quercicolus]